MTSSSLDHPEGAVYLLDKREGVTSREAADLVAEAWGYGKRGHAGTLDPDATGVLIALLGKATRLSRFVAVHDKTYRFTVRLGVTTDTCDSSGRVLSRTPAEHVTADQVEEALAVFTGTFQQRIPRFSAARIEGRRAFKAARKGETLDMPTKEVTATEWKLVDYSPGKAVVEVRVSKGTYVRALARDIGDTLETGGCAESIRRLSVGRFRVEECSPEANHQAALRPMAEAMRGYPSMSLGGINAVSARHGRALPGKAQGFVSLLDKADRLLAIGRGDGTTVKPICVLRPL